MISMKIRPRFDLPTRSYFISGGGTFAPKHANDGTHIFAWFVCQHALTNMHKNNGRKKGPSVGVVGVVGSSVEAHSVLRGVEHLASHIACL